MSITRSSPSFVGAKPYEDAYVRGVKVIGATAHYVTHELDQGPIIEQRVKVIRHSHKIEDLKLIGRECEKEAFAFALRKHIENKLVVFRNRVVVFE
jgi:formyltetrahydrofolate deformylase